MASAIAPVGLCYAYVAWRQGNSDDAMMVAIISGIAILIAYLFINIFSKTIATTTVKMTSIEAADSENLSFMLLYLLPLFENDISSLNWSATFPAAIIFGWVIWSGYGHHFNPVLSFLGWHYFKVSTPEGVTYILISKKAFRSCEKDLQVKQLTEYIILDTGER